MLSLLKAAQHPDFPTRISLVFSDCPDAEGLALAQREGVTVWKKSLRDFTAKENFEAALHQKLIAHHIDILCLAGYMRILGEEFIALWQGKILNIHPSLLPDFPGLNTHHRLLKSGKKHHGCTVHFVDTGLDSGPIVERAKIKVAKDDTEQSLSHKVLMEEYKLYPKILRLLAEEKISFSDPQPKKR